MKLFYDSLSEKDWRRYAAVERRNSRTVGSQYIAAVLFCCEDTIRQGQDDENFMEVVADHTAGDSMCEDVVFTWLSPTQIPEQLAERRTPVCRSTVEVLLDVLGYRRRQTQSAPRVDRAARLPASPRATSRPAQDTTGPPTV